MGSFEILSIHGGGIRGIIPAVVLGEIERRYFRFQTELTHADDDMGDVSPVNLFRLKGERLVGRERGRLGKPCEVLAY